MRVGNAVFDGARAWAHTRKTAMGKRLERQAGLIAGARATLRMLNPESAARRKTRLAAFTIFRELEFSSKARCSGARREKRMGSVVLR